MAALQSSFASLNLGTNSFLGQRLSPSIYLPVLLISNEANGKLFCCLTDSTLALFNGVKSTELPGSIVAKLKRWERKECKPNSLPVIHKMHVKLGDTVKVISGKDKGKVGEVARIITHNSSIVIKDINLKTKHVKSKEEGEQGQIIKIEAPIHSSNVMLYSKEQDVCRELEKVVKEKEKSTELAAAAS
ncbi:hypothetical protein DH2020_008636 [Rehmannia glutinosa]|uniref:KOW domain-containing protein n=1 Tax=Rehmannia glutinosa TaxID=99300 RepID=A0ABR0X409_REHGL